MALTAVGLTAFICTFIAVATIIVGLRMFVRTVMRNIGSEDVLTTASWVFTFVTAACALASLQPISREQRYIGREFYVCVVSGVLGLSLGKAGAGVALLRLSGQGVCWRRRMLHGCLFVLGILSIGTLLVNVVQPCSVQHSPSQAPFCFYYDPRIEAGLVLAWSIFGAVLDLILSVTAMMIVYSANLSREKKTALYALFGLGWLAAPFSILRAVVGRSVVNNMGLFFISTTLEMFLVLVCPSIPTLMPFFRGWKHTGLGTVQTGVVGSVTGTARPNQPKAMQQPRIRGIDSDLEQVLPREDDTGQLQGSYTERGRSRQPRT